MSMLSLAIILLCLTFGPQSAPSTAQDANTPRVHTRPYLEYGNICWENETARLDNFAIVLASDRDAIGYITVYDGRLSCRKEAEARAIRARNYLVNFRGIEWNRVSWRYGGGRQDFTMLAHVFPRGAQPLEPEATVGASEITEDCGAKTRRRPKCPAR
jgi:hypothetical protein